MKLDLLELVSYHDYQITSRSLSKKLSLNQAVTLYAMDKGETISQETSPKSKLLQVLEGELEISYEETSEHLIPNQLLMIEANQLHAIKALTPTKWLQIECD